MITRKSPGFAGRGFPLPHMRGNVLEQESSPLMNGEQQSRDYTRALAARKSRKTESER